MEIDFSVWIVGGISTDKWKLLSKSSAEKYSNCKGKMNNIGLIPDFS